MKFKYTFSCLMNETYVNCSVSAASEDDAKKLIKKYYNCEGESVVLVSVEESN